VEHDEPSYEEFVRAHNLQPLNDIKTACRVLNVGHTRFYSELVDSGQITLIPNGSRRNVTAMQLYKHHCALVDKAKNSHAA